MHALHDRHVQLWLILFLVVIALACGVYAGTRLGTTTNTTVYEYAVSIPSATGEPITLEYGAWPALTNVDFFTQVRERLVAEKAHFVEANLTAMELRVYREGVVALTVPIKSKGREGSWWETPSGLYRAEAKKDNHFSSFGQVYMPWSIPFQGNFFIHGWPYYPDGTRVATTYSGGCIRLEDTYAREVYDLVDVGMPILVYEENASSSDVPYVLNVPEVRATSYLVADLDTNFLLLGSETATVRESTIPGLFVTALVASEHQNIERMITVPHDFATKATTSRFVGGTTYSLYDLFFPLLKEASHDSAHIIASHFGKARFLHLLDSRARAIGMRHSTFFESGVSGQNRTTAEDVFLLLKYLRQNRSFLLSLSAGTVDTRIYGAPTIEGVGPTHPLWREANFLGGMHDRVHTPSPVGASGNEAAILLAFATSTLSHKEDHSLFGSVALFKVAFGGGMERTIAFIALDSSDPAGDIQAMRSYITMLYR